MSCRRRGRRCIAIQTCSRTFFNAFQTLSHSNSPCSSSRTRWVQEALLVASSKSAFQSFHFVFDIVGVKFLEVENFSKTHVCHTYHQALTECSLMQQQQGSTVKLHVLTDKPNVLLFIQRTG